MVIDASPRMLQPQDNGEIPLQSALECVKAVLLSKAFSSPSDSVGVMVYGTVRTNLRRGVLVVLEVLIHGLYSAPSRMMRVTTTFTFYRIWTHLTLHALKKLNRLQPVGYLPMHYGKKWYQF